MAVPVVLDIKSQDNENEFEDTSKGVTTQSQWATGVGIGCHDLTTPKCVSTCIFFT